MVNNVVLEYLRVNKGNYKIADLRAKIISSGYSKQDVDEALVELNKQTGGKAPAVESTIKQINDTSLKVSGAGGASVNAVAKPVDVVDLSSAAKPVDVVDLPSVAKPVGGVPKKSKAWIWVVVVIILLLAAASAAAWWFFLR